MLASVDPSRYPVLAVDDEPDNLEIIRYNFRQRHPLLLARSGAEALQILGQKSVSVIVSDQRMPGMTGLQLLARAREVQPDAAGVLLTAYADVPVLLEAINSGLVYRCLQKPF